MSIISRRTYILGILLLVCGFGAGASRTFAANEAKRLQPTPAPSPAQPSAADLSETPLASDASMVAEDGACEEFCGMPVCSPPGRFWLRADYLVWWTSGTRLPPLVTTSPTTTPVDQAGVLDLPTTTVLYGNGAIANDGRSGIRTTIGMWLDACHVWDLEFDYMNLDQGNDNFSATSTGDPILTRPFFNIQDNRLASELVSYPGIAFGSVSVESRDYFQSAGVSLSYNLCSCGSCCDPCGDVCGESCGNSCSGSACGIPLLRCCRTDLLVGFRYYGLDDRIGIHENPTLLTPTPPHNTVATFDIHDNFSASNEFYGSEIGLRTELYRGRWSLNILSKVAIGNNHQTVTINGQTVITAPNQTPQTYNSGILAGPTNSGVFQRDAFTMIPQLGLELGYQLTCHWRAYVGYNLLYWGCVARAADQIDLNLDPRNFPPKTTDALPFPAFPGRTSSFWAQGVNVGTEFRF